MSDAPVLYSVDAEGIATITLNLPEIRCKVDDLAGHRVHELIGVHEVLHRVFFH